jgi:hypothetical protein
MARRPGLFNEAIAGFYRSTEEIARKRAARVETVGLPGAPASPRGGSE